MEESQLQGKILYCCFVDFKKAFDIVPRSELWKRMIGIRMPLDYREFVAKFISKSGANENGWWFFGVLFEQHGRLSKGPHTLWPMHR